MAHGTATNSIELSGDAKSFDRVARKWNVDYAFYKTGPDKYLLFFKAGQADAKSEKREQFEQRHSRELILYDAAARYLKELKDSGETITPKAWQREIDQLAAGKQTDTLAMKAMREDLKAVERLRKTAEQLSRQERNKSHDREPER